MEELAHLGDDELEQLAAGLREERLKRHGDSHPCEVCGHQFLGRKDSRYCSGRCRTAAYRMRVGKTA